MSSTGSYRHTQVGWVIIGSLLAAAALTAVLLPPVLGAMRWVVPAILLLLLPLFGTLTVTVDHDSLRARFGVGLLGTRVPLPEVRTFRVVTSPWYHGWGIRLIPGGWLYNVSGLSAVELLRTDGKLVRIGTDEPEELLAAIERAAGPRDPLTPQEAAEARTTARRAVLVFAAVGVLLVGLIGAMFFVQTRPLSVKVTADAVAVDDPFYGETYAMADISSASLEPSMPRVLARTNGFALGNTLRGNFEVEGLGRGKLFVEAGRPPFILMRLREGYVIFNLDDPARTRQVHEAIERARGR